MSQASGTVPAEIQRYINSGETDPIYRAWSGDILERSQRASRELRSALTREVRRRARGHKTTPVPPSDLVAFTRQKVGPMVHGLFLRREWDAILAVLERSMVFVTGDNIDRLLREIDFNHSGGETGRPQSRHGRLSRLQFHRRVYPKIEQLRR